MSVGLTKEQLEYMESEDTDQYTCAKLTKMVKELDKRIRELEKENRLWE